MADDENSDGKNHHFPHYSTKDRKNEEEREEREGWEDEEGIQELKIRKGRE